LPVTEKSGTVVVRGRAYRICSKSCGLALMKDPDKYLDRDGTVKADKNK
jgi:hypothetical protein